MSMNRRKFNELTMAALGGLTAGAVVGCGPAAKPPAAGSPGTAAAASDMHVCRGLNACKGKGADGKNACAGQGGCAAAKAKHECKGKNTCKGAGGCGEAAGKNECKEKGNCAVPITKDDAWKKAREGFEADMKKAGKEAGPAPAK